ALELLDVELGELRLVVEVLAQRVGLVRVLMQHPQVELVRPPILVGPRPRAGRFRGLDCRVLAFGHFCPFWFGGFTRKTTSRRMRGTGPSTRPRPRRSRSRRRR